MSDQFFITLPSNTEKDSTASNFRVKLPNHIKLDGEWEVGLAEIIYINSWFNLNAQNYNNLIQIKLSDVPGHAKLHDKIFIPPSYYESIDELLNALNIEIKRRQHYKINGRLLIQFGYDRHSRLVSLTVDPKYIDYVILSPRLHEILGITYAGKGYFKQVEHTYPYVVHGIRPPDLSSHIETLYLYCNIIENQIVGNILAPLLRIVDVHGKYGQIANKIYDNPHYIPLLLKDINFIEINIKNDMNEYIIFEFGKVVVKLHFRKRSYF